MRSMYIEYKNTYVLKSPARILWAGGVRGAIRCELGSVGSPRERGLY